MRKAFICYSSADKAFVQRLAKALEESDVSVWVDEKEILVGDDIRSKIEEGLNASDYLVIVLSPDSVESPWVAKELDAKLIEEVEAHKVTVLPLLHHECEIPPLLKGKHYADFRADFARGLRELLARFKHADREQELKGKVLRRLGEADPYRIDPHALAAIAIQAREIDAAEELIKAHEESVPGCPQMLSMKAMLAHTRFMTHRNVDDFIAAVDMAYELVGTKATQQALNNLHGICITAPTEKKAVDHLLQLLERTRQLVGRSPTAVTAPICATAFLYGIHRSSLSYEQITEACGTVCEIVESASAGVLRPCISGLLHVCTHLIGHISDDVNRKEYLGRLVTAARPKIGDAREYADAFLHLSWAASQIDEFQVAEELLGKYRLTVTTEEFERGVNTHPPLDSLAFAT